MKKDCWGRGYALTCKNSWIKIIKKKERTNMRWRAAVSMLIWVTKAREGRTRERSNSGGESIDHLPCTIYLIVNVNTPPKATAFFIMKWRSTINMMLTIMLRHPHLQLPPMQLLEPCSVHMLWFNCNLSFGLFFLLPIIIIFIIMIVINIIILTTTKMMMMSLAATVTCPLGWSEII